MSPEPLHAIPPRGQPGYVRVDDYELMRVVELWPEHVGTDGPVVMGFLLHGCSLESRPEGFVPVFGDLHGDGPSDDIAKSEPYCAGSIKWDGCVDFQYPYQNECMLHACGARDFETDLKTWQLLYRQARAFMPSCE